jgi:hypothetical protein
MPETCLWTPDTCRNRKYLGSAITYVTSSSLDNLSLLVQGEVLPGELWTHVFLEQSKDLVVRDGTWVGEVVDAGLLVLSQEDGCWEEVGEDGVGVGDVDDALVLGDLGDEVTRVQVVADGHTKSENEGVGVVLHDLPGC